MAKRFLCGGAIDPNRQVYVSRQADQTILDLLQQGNSVNLHAGRQTGKTSLMFWAKDTLEQQGHVCISLDLTLLFQQGSLLDGLYRLAKQLRDKLAPDYALPAIRRSRNDSIASVLARLLHHLAQIPTNQDNQRLYLLLDEVDVLMRFPAPVCAEFFLALRQCFNTPSSDRERLALLLVSVMTPSEMIFGHESGGIGINFLRDVPLAAFQPSPAVLD